MGPLFIVGLSRSGTKLLREILNKHPAIRIPNRESYFVPHVLNEFAGRRGPPDDRSREKFIRRFRHGVFYNNMARQGRYLPVETLRNLVDRPTWSDIIEAIFRYYAGPAEVDYIWGDKTPRYLNHMQLLQAHFPRARFLHIYRDPRDRVLSAQDAWGANLYIGAQQWLDAMQRASRQATGLGDAYMTVCYETLVADPAAVAREVCAFLDLPYLPQMTRLDAPVERLGDASHATRRETTILAENTQKYRSRLSPEQLARIEQIIFPFAAGLGYRPEAGTLPHRPLSRSEWLRYSVPHYLGGLRILTGNWGALRGTGYAISRWRL